MCFVLSRSPVHVCACVCMCVSSQIGKAILEDESLFSLTAFVRPVRPVMDESAASKLPLWARTATSLPFTAWALAQPWYLQYMASRDHPGVAVSDDTHMHTHTCTCTHTHTHTHTVTHTRARTNIRTQRRSERSPEIAGHKLGPVMYTRMNVYVCVCVCVFVPQGAESCLPARRAASRVRSEFPEMDTYASLPYQEQLQVVAPQVRSV